MAELNMRQWLGYFEERREQLVQMTRALVEMESPSDDKPALDRMCAHLARALEGLGAQVQIHRSPQAGDSLQADFPGPTARKPVMLLGHFDTVYPLGTLSKMPCVVAGNKLTGPGVLDMKSGIALMLAAVKGLFERRRQLPRPVTVLLVSDEEVGSDSSRPITEGLAKKSQAVLVCEPSYGLRGAVKTARKGVGEYTIQVQGKAAHSGLDFEKGQNAIVELAGQIARIVKFVDLKRGLTLNPGVISGGTRVNVVPAEATAFVDVRIARLRDAAGIDRKLKSLKPINKKCKLKISGGINRPPMEPTPAIASLYKLAAELARQMGWKLEEAAVGGGSDGNFTAALAIPTLDGLGGVGDGAHAPTEHVLIPELPRRTALLAGLLESI